MTDIGMVDEVLATETHDCYDDGVMDGGATTGCVGSCTVDMYSQALTEKLGWESPVKFFPCIKRLRFGDDKVVVARTCARVPACISGHFVIMWFYVIPGKTPFLVPRPMMEILDVTVSYGGRRAQIGKFEECSQPVARNSKGHYILKLGNFDVVPTQEPELSLLPKELVEQLDLKIGDRDELFNTEGGDDYAGNEF